MTTDERGTEDFTARTSEWDARTTRAPSVRRVSAAERAAINARLSEQIRADARAIRERREQALASILSR